MITIISIKFSFQIIFVIMIRLVGSDLENFDSMIKETSALGRSAQIGDLFDARYDRFTGFNIFKGTSFMQNRIISAPENSNEIKLTRSYSYEERFNAMDLTPDVKLSVLAHLFLSSGSGKFLRDNQRTSKIEKVSVIQKITTVKEMINISEPGINELIDYDVLEQIGATHMVIGIVWGGYVCLPVENHIDTGISMGERMKIYLDRFITQTRVSEKSKQNFADLIQSAIDWVTGKSSLPLNDQDKIKIEKFTIGHFYSDFRTELPINQHLKLTVLETLKFMTNTTGLINSHPNGKGVPMKYILLPILELNKILNMDILVGKYSVKIGESAINECVHLFDEINLTGQKVEDFESIIVMFEDFIPADRIRAYIQFERDFDRFSATTVEGLKSLLVNIRSGRNEESALFDFIRKTRLNKNDIENIELPKFFDLEDEFNLLVELINLNVSILTRIISIKRFLSENEGKDVYIFQYNSKVSGSDKIILEKFKTIVTSNVINGDTTRFAAINYEFVSDKRGQILQARISFYKDDVLVSENF